MVRFLAEDAAELRSAARTNASRPTWVVLLFALLPLAVRFALANAALFRNFFQRGFLVGLLFGHDFAHALGYAYGRGLRSQVLGLRFRYQQRDFAFDFSSRF